MASSTWIILAIFQLMVSLPVIKKRESLPRSTSPFSLTLLPQNLGGRSRSGPDYANFWPIYYDADFGTTGAQ